MTASSPKTNAHSVTDTSARSVGLHTSRLTLAFPIFLIRRKHGLQAVSISLLNGSRDGGQDKKRTKLHLASQEQSAVCNYQYVLLMKIFRFLSSK